MHGRYAPPAVEWPCITVTCGIPAADSRAWLAKPRPPSMNTSPTCIRLAPPDSTSRTTGSLFSSAIASARRLLRMPIGVIVPPLIALSEANTMQRTPETMPMPVTMPPPSTFFSPSSSCMR